MFQAAAPEVVGKLLLHVVGQASAFGFPEGEEGRVVLLDDAVQQGRFRLVTPVTGRGCD